MKKRHARTVVSAVLLAVAAGAMAWENDAGNRLFRDIRKGVLENGLTWIYQQDLSSDCTSAVILIKGGKKAEPDGLSGLSYIVTRLAVEIPDDGKLKELMTQATQLNVRTEENHSRIGIQCLSGNFQGTMGLVGKLVRNPLFSGIRISSLKEWIRHRAKEVSDDSVQNGHDIIAAHLLGPSGPGGPAWGTETSLDAVRKGDVEAFHDRWFRGSRILISVVSDLRENEVVDIIRKSFSRLPRGEDLREEAAAPAPKNTAEKTIRINRDSRQTYIGFGWTVPASSRSSHVMAVLAENILGGGVGSKLWELRENRSLAYNVNSSLTWTAEGGFIEAYLETSPAKAEESSLAMKSITVRLGESGISEEELAIAKRSAAVSFCRNVESKEGRAMAWAFFESLGAGGLPGGTFLDELDLVRLDELNAFLRSVFAKGAGCEVVIGPGACPEE